jgi:glycosyltransferase involved in cell wall biosynthesis
MGSRTLQVAVPSLPTVSVALTAYKAERTLPQAIDSILAQRTDFPIEIIVSDDCSPDGVGAIAKAYQNRHPHIVRILARERNVGMQRNYYETFAMCRGRYIAWLDGDDYWTDPDKLTRQVEALEADPSISLCGHYVRWVTREGPVLRERYPERPPGRYGIEDILRKNFLPSPSIVFRNGIQRNLPPWYFDIAPLADWPVNILAALSGDILMLDHVMADYTLNPGSACWGKGEQYWYSRDAAFYDLVEPLVPSYRRLVRREKAKRYEALYFLLRRQEDLRGAREAAVKAFLAAAGSGNIFEGTKHMLASVAYEIAGRAKGHRALLVKKTSAGD